MNPELEKLFEQAVGLAKPDREKFLAENCSDPNLREEVSLLLDHDRGAETFLQRAVSEEASSALQTVVFAPGQRVGSYRILSVIGHGGMGLVYLAERADGKFEQRVAIKVLQSHLDMRLLGERIQQECRILASLEHPNIARVLDADVTRDALPYFVMEYVDGQPIDRYCESHKLSTRDRLRLLLPVCDAVRLAHQNLIVHRDLKPDNILVTEQGIPKLLDFGIAKVLSEAPVSAQNTATRVLTPEYASPEQARGNPVTTATDIYSLGGVLYKLLTGSAPHQLADKSPLETVRAICDEDVRKPSELRGELAGDVDSILLMTLHRDPQRRYHSVDQFAGDIERLLDEKPVLARPDTVWYRSGKFVRRHVVAVGMSTVVVLLVVTFAILQAIQLRQTRIERDRANRERDRATRITDFMTTMFKVSDPSAAGGSRVTAREILDKASNEINKGMAQDPQQQAQMMHVMGTVYFNLGLYSEAEPLMSRALDIRRRILGPNDPDTVASMSQLARILGWQGRAQEAEKLQTEVVDIRRRTLGAENLDTINSMSQLANTLSAEGRLADADKLAREIVDLRSRVQGPENLATIESMQYVALVLTREGKYSDAEEFDRKVLDFRKRVQGADHPDVLASMSRLAGVLDAEGRYGEAESLLRESLATGLKVLGPDHALVTVTKQMLAGVLGEEARYAEAEKLEREVLDTQRRVNGSENPGTLNAMVNLGNILTSERHCAEAEGLLRRAIDGAKRVFSPSHPLVLTAQAELGLTLDCEGHFLEAEKIERASLDGLSRTLGPERPDTLHSMINLATILSHIKKYREAAQLARQAQDIDRRVFGPHHPETAAATYGLACISAQREQMDDSFSLLQESIDGGLAPNLLLEIVQNPDLKSLHNDHRWEPLVASAKQNAAAILKTN